MTLPPMARCVYNSQMAGTRTSTTMEISFQSKPGSSELGHRPSPTFDSCS